MSPSGVSLRHDAQDLEALRALLVQMLQEGRGEEAISLLVGLLGDLRDQNDTLRVRLQSALRHLYGKRSEKLSKDQLELFSKLVSGALQTPPDEPAAPAPSETDATTPPEAAPPSTPKPAAGGKPTRPGTPHGRGAMPEGLPRTTQSRPVPEHLRVCACGRRMEGFDAEPSWQVEFVPGQFVVQITECEKVSCPVCRNEVRTAPAPAKVLPGGQPGPGLLAKLIVDKAEDHLPIERQQRRMTREGWQVPPTTLEGWWSASLDLLAPLHAPCVLEAIQSGLPQVDATGLEVRDLDHPKGVRLGHLWSVLGERAVAFVYTEGKSAGLQDLLVQRCDPVTHRGEPILCDGENLFGSVQVRGGFELVLLNCNMHARRYFERAFKGGDLRAGVALQLYSRLYEVERRARSQGLGVEALTGLRQAESGPLLEQLREWCLEQQPQVPPSTPLGKALGYVSRRWLSLSAFVLDGRIPLDTGGIERQIRWIAVGRNNWLACGSESGARRLATAATLCATCRLLGLNPWTYLRDVLRAIAEGVSVATLVEDFTPWAWAQHQAQQTNAQQPLAPD